ncbi:hypothetical protein EX30DRAFT_389252, partial [Ascodesmis nigricans]
AYPPLLCLLPLSPLRPPFFQPSTPPTATPPSLLLPRHHNYHQNHDPHTPTTILDLFTTGAEPQPTTTQQPYRYDIDVPPPSPPTKPTPDQTRYTLSLRYDSVSIDKTIKPKPFAPLVAIGVTVRTRASKREVRDGTQWEKRGVKSLVKRMRRWGKGWGSISRGSGSGAAGTGGEGGVWRLWFWGW